MYPHRERRDVNAVARFDGASALASFGNKIQIEPKLNSPTPGATSPVSWGVWQNPPPSATLDEHLRSLRVRVAAGTDLWSRTHYGFVRKDAHYLPLAALTDEPSSVGAPVVRGGEEEWLWLSARVAFSPQRQYDQCGLLLWLSEDTWLKTSIEYEGAEPARLGAVVTRDGHSDWSTADVPSTVRAAEFRLRTRTQYAGDWIVEARLLDSIDAASTAAWSQLRITHVGSPLGALPTLGVYACSPMYLEGANASGALFECAFAHVHVGHGALPSGAH